MVTTNHHMGVIMDPTFTLRLPSRHLFAPLFLVAVLALLALAPGLVQTAGAVDRGTIFKAGGNVNVPAGDTADAVIAIGGDVSVGGTVKSTIVAVGGDVHLLSTADVGSEAGGGDTSVVLVGGTLTRAQGATVTGDVSRVSGSWAGDIWDRGIADPISAPFRGFSLFAWIGGTLLSLLGAVLIAALLPRQVLAIRDGVRSHFWPSLGWGALSLIVIVPLVTVLLIVTIIGLLAILPWLFVVVSALVLGAVGIAVLIGSGILPRLNYRGESLILAAVVGVLVLRLVQLIPFVGSIVVGIAWLLGFGATVMAVWMWQRRRREHVRELRQAGGEQRAA